MRPLIAITVERGGRQRLAAYLAALRAAGAAPLPVEPGAGRMVERVQGVLLPGGPDIDPCHYRERPRPWLGRVDPELDELELELARRAWARGLPLLGICRGQQVVNVALGGTLYQDLRADGVTAADHAVPRRRGLAHLAHPIVLQPATRLWEVAGAARVPANSRHHQAVKDVASGLVVSARSPDGVVEGLESDDGLVLAVQCHPENLVSVHPWAARLFRTFVQAAEGGGYGPARALPPRGAGSGRSTPPPTAAGRRMPR